MTEIQITAALAYGFTAAWLLMFYLVAAHALGTDPLRALSCWLADCYRRRMARKRYEAEIRRVRQLRKTL